MSIEIHSLTKRYSDGSGSGSIALDGLRLSIPCGVVFALLGPVGAGKTTILGIIGGHIKPTSGSVRVNGYCLGRERVQARQQIAAYFHDLRNLESNSSVKENLVFNALASGLSRREAEIRSEEFLGEFGLFGQRDRKVRFLSASAQKRVSLAAAFGTASPVLLLDDPFAEMDRRTVCVILNRLRQFVEADRTVVLATGSLKLAVDAAHDIALLQEGRVVERVAPQRSAWLSQPLHFQIRVKGRLSEEWCPSFDEGVRLSVRRGETTLSGTIPDQSALYGLLSRVRDLGLPLLSVEVSPPDLAELCWWDVEAD